MERDGREQKAKGRIERERREGKGKGRMEREGRGRPA